jgi:hypothetical protein
MSNVTRAANRPPSDARRTVGSYVKGRSAISYCLRFTGRNFEMLSGRIQSWIGAIEIDKTRSSTLVKCLNR